MSNSGEDRNDWTHLAAAVVVTVKEDLRNMRPRRTRVHRCEQLILVGGESLDQTQAVTEDVDREAGAGRLVRDKFQQLLASGRLIVYIHVDHVIKKEIKRTFFRHRRNIDPGVGG